MSYTVLRNPFSETSVLATVELSEELTDYKCNLCGDRAELIHRKPLDCNPRFIAEGYCKKCLNECN